MFPLPPMKNLAPLTLAAVVALFGAASAIAQPPPGYPPAPPIVDPNTHPERLTKVSPHVWMIPDNSMPSVANIGIIVGSRAALVVDTGMGPYNGDLVYKAALKLAGSKPMYLVTTHIHPEHDLGAQGFPASVKLLRSKIQIQDIAENGQASLEGFRRREAYATLLKDARFRPADIVYDKTYELDLGDVKVKMVATGQNHTLGDTYYWIPADGVLFSGDLATRLAPLFNAKSSVRDWQKTLVELAALKPKIIVGAHGPVGDAAAITGYQNFFGTIQKRAAELKKQGKTSEETTAIVTPEVVGLLPNGLRGTTAIRSAYAEAL